MKKTMAVFLSAALVSLVGTAAFAAEEDLVDGTVEARVALITMDHSDVHWIRISEAAEERVAAYNAAGSQIELLWMAPEKKDDELQAEKIEAAVEEGVDYIIIAVTSATGCDEALAEAMDAGIGVIYVDSPADLEACATFATDNYAGGVQAGEYLLEALTDAGLTEGTIGIVDAQEGVESCQDRFDGFASVFEKTDFELGERQYSGGETVRAEELAAEMVDDGVVAIYGTNEGATNGAASAVSFADHPVFCVGWDNSDANITHVECGDLLAFMAQNPDVMGTDAIDSVVRLELGEDLGGETVDTGVSPVTIANLDEFK